MRKWRWGKAQEMHIPAFYIFSNEGLRAIAGGDIRTKEDLLFIKGINKRKYDLYGDDLFEIIQKFIDEENEGRKKDNDEQSGAKANNSFMDCIKDNNRFERKNKFNILPEDVLDRPETTVTEPKQVDCKKCILYKREDCFVESQICAHFEPSPDISEEEIRSWPKYGDASYYRFYSKQSR